MPAVVLLALAAVLGAVALALLTRAARLPGGWDHYRDPSTIARDEETRATLVRVAIITAFVLAAAAWGDLAASELVRPGPGPHIETARDQLADHLFFVSPLIGFAALVIALTAYIAARRRRAARRWAIVAALAALTAPIAFMVFLVEAFSQIAS